MWILASTTRTQTWTQRLFLETTQWSWLWTMCWMCCRRMLQKCPRLPLKEVCRVECELMDSSGYEYLWWYHGNVRCHSLRLLQLDARIPGQVLRYCMSSPSSMDALLVRILGYDGSIWYHHCCHSSWTHRVEHPPDNHLDRSCHRLVHWICLVALPHVPVYSRMLLFETQTI